MPVGTIAPDPNQLVRVLDRLWVVADVQRAGQHLVTLTSVEDDGSQEELRVVWELESGVEVLADAELPAPEQGRFDDPDRLDAFLDAVRWGAITSADSRALQAPFRSGISIEDYQLDPVVRALRMPRVNLLIADDVGLGKTIEAGLVVQELLLRHRARTVLVVCPASLCVKWREEMAGKFGLDFRIVDTELLRDLRRRQGLYASPMTWLQILEFAAGRGVTEARRLSYRALGVEQIGYVYVRRALRSHGGPRVPDGLGAPW